jgi:hypothetical protein
MTTLAPSQGTTWHPSVREHVATHQPPCIGSQAGMPGDCLGGSELDHVRAGGMGMKSPSVATNAARLCGWHHSLKTREGRTWRPRLLAVIARLASTCSRCQRESIEVWHHELEAAS